jgi:hypothetical protein
VAALDSIPTKTVGIEGATLTTGCLRLLGLGLLAIGLIMIGLIAALL